MESVNLSHRVIGCALTVDDIKLAGLHMHFDNPKMNDGIQRFRPLKMYVSED